MAGRLAAALLGAVVGACALWVSAATPAPSLNFIAHSYTLPLGFPTPMAEAIGDLDGVKGPDVVLAGFTGNLAIFLNDGHGGFQPPAILPGQCPDAVNGPAGVAIGHFTSSGHPDILVACDDAVHDGFVKYPGHGNGTFGTPVRIAPIQAFVGEDTNRRAVFVGIQMASMVHGSFGGTQAVAWAEFQSGGGYLLCALGDADVVADSGTGPFGPACSADVVNGTLMDALDFPPPVTLGSVAFATPTQFAFTLAPGGGLSTGTALGAAFSAPSFSPPFAAGYSSLLFEPQHSIAGGFPSLLGAADLNGDGTSELFVEAGVNADQLAVEQLTGTDNSGTILIADPQLYATNPAVNAMRGVTTGDFDGDGKPDVALLGETENGETWLEVAPGDGNDGLGPFQSFQVADFTTEGMIDSADFNGDGKRDILTVTRTSPPGITLFTNATPSAPTLSSFAPLVGPAGTAVTITGAHFGSATEVTFNGTPAVGFTVQSDTQLTATVAPGTTSGLVRVITPSGTATSARAYIVPAFPPTVHAFSPAQGHIGASVAISGVHFTGLTAVKFNGTPAVSFLAVSDTLITAAVPAGATSGRISVTTGSGTTSSVAAFTVLPAVAPAPSITSFTPTSGNHGVRVVLRGSAFTGATSVKFNGLTALFTVVSDGIIYAYVPVGATSGPIAVTTAAGTGTSVASFTA